MSETKIENPIVITPNAAAEIKRRLAEGKFPAEGGLRLAVKGGGCSGFSYVFDLDQGPKEGDLVFEQDGARAFVDPKSFKFLQGLRVDFNPGMYKHGFQFENPNATKSCGCGSSFSM